MHFFFTFCSFGCLFKMNYNMTILKEIIKKNFISKLWVFK